jgi:hypothetical protein
LDSHLAETSPYPAFSWVTDDLILNDNTTLTEFPFGIARDDWGAQGYHPQAAIGLGRNSTILNTLYSAVGLGQDHGRCGGEEQAQV